MKLLRTHKIIFVAALALAAAGCGKGATETGTSDADLLDTALYNATLEVAPSFTPATDASVSKSPTKEEWQSGSPLYELFYLLRDFNPETDNGVIDTSNLYKTMWESKNFVSSAKWRCGSIVEQVISPPFDFGNEDASFNCAYNDVGREDGYDFGGAMKEVDANGVMIEPIDYFKTSYVEQQGLFGFVWVDLARANPHYEYGSLEGSVNTETGDLSVDIAVWVDYDDVDDYCYRNDIDGNSETNEFTLRSAKGNGSGNSQAYSVVGKGISKGEGNYMLFKVNHDGTTGKYFCIGAEEGEAELKAREEQTGSDTVDANCAEYADAVNDMEHLTADDLLCDSADLNPDGPDDIRGTIYLNFN